MRKCIKLLTRLSFALTFICLSCNKRSELEKIPDSSLRVLESVEDAQALLDNTTIMRETPKLSELSADNFYVKDSVTFGLDLVELNAYLWEPDIFKGQKLADDWFNPYQQVYYANSVLASLPRLTAATKQQINQLKGGALFIRAYAFHNVALEFARLYTQGSANDSPGIPVRLVTDPLVKTTRATVKETYDQILSDALVAASLLAPQPDPRRKNRPSTAAAFALLARVYLSMGDYVHAKLYADSCLQLYSNLIDYNSIPAGMINPFSANNEEVLYQSNLLSTTSMFYPGMCYVDSVLYQSFSSLDLRKDLFFSHDNAGLPILQYSYSGDITRFSGLAVDEVLLISAECKARLENKEGALLDLSTLLKSRWKNKTYSPPAVNSAAEVLDLVLQERRKELVFRGLRWADIRRLNNIRPDITLKRVYKGKQYILPAGDNRFILPIPPDVIAINSDVAQNPR